MAMGMGMGMAMVPKVIAEKKIKNKKKGQKEEGPLLSLLLSAKGTHAQDRTEQSRPQ